jgi:hypothetical protein
LPIDSSPKAWYNTQNSQAVFAPQKLLGKIGTGNMVSHQIAIVTSIDNHIILRKSNAGQLALLFDLSDNLSGQTKMPVRCLPPLGDWLHSLLNTTKPVGRPAFWLYLVTHRLKSHVAKISPQMGTD